MLCLVALCLVLAVGVSHAGRCDSLNMGLLYPHTTNNGDSEIDFSGGDPGSIPVELDGRFKLYGTSYRKIWIGTNGYVTFDAGSADADPTGTMLDPPKSSGGAPLPTIAVLWAETFGTATPAQAPRMNIWYRETNNSALITRFTNDVQDGFTGGCDRDSETEFKYLLIVTWSRQVPQCQSYAPGPLDCNSFQLVYGTTGANAFVMMNYVHINWPISCLDKVTAGFSDLTFETRSFDIIGTSYRALINSANVRSLTPDNPESGTRKMYKVDGNILRNNMCQRIEDDGTITP